MQAKLSTSSVKGFDAQEKAYEVVDSEIKGFLMRVQPTGRKTFYFTYRTEAGVRKRIKIGVLGSSLTLAQARDQALAFAAQASSGKDIQGEKTTNRKIAKEKLSHTLDAFLTTHYRPWALTNQKSGQQTIDTIRSSFPDLLPLPLSEITLKQIERLRTEKIMGGLKPSTVNRKINALRGAISRALDWGILETHPLAKLKALKMDAGIKARYLSEDEEKRLFNALKSRDEEIKAARARGNQFRKERGYDLMADLYQFTYADRMTPLITLSLKTGARRGELFDLRWDDIDFTNRVLTIRGEIAKSSKTRHIPLSPIAFETITHWKKQAPTPTGRVFPSDDGNRLDNVKNSWTSILEAATIKSFRWHDMRHDFASKLVMKGVPLNTVRELCGHADLNTTLRYAHLAPDHKADAVALIG
jgi:integrase